MAFLSNNLFRKTALSLIGVILGLTILNSINSKRSYTIGNPIENDKPDFIETLRHFEWNKLLHAYQNKKVNTSDFSLWYSKLLLVLTPWIVAPPKIPLNLNKSCGFPPPLKYPFNAPPCRTLKNSTRKVAVLLQLGFDADTLEIHMHELDQVADKFFLIESTSTYYLGASKPLIWEILRSQPRFQMFLHKVIHFVLDDQDLLAAQVEAIKSEKGHSKDRPNSIEILQEKMRWVKFAEWNNLTKHFGKNDLVGFGDVDEVPNRNVVHYLKNCEMPSDPLDIATWFPNGRIDQAFRTDAPVKGHPYSYGDPTYWTLKRAMEYDGKEFWFTSVPSRLRGKSPGYIIGGMHMTHYGYFPFILNKLLTVIEGYKVQVQNNIASLIKFVMNELQLKRKIISMSNAERNAALEKMEMELAKTPSNFMPRITKVDNLRRKNPKEYKMLVQLPWFYDCNRQRYPAWEGNHDNRLDV